MGKYAPIFPINRSVLNGSIPNRRRFHIALAVSSDGAYVGHAFNRFGRCAERCLTDKLTVRSTDTMVVIAIYMRRNNTIKKLGDSLPCERCQHHMHKGEDHKVAYSQKNGGLHTCRVSTLPTPLMRALHG